MLAGIRRRDNYGPLNRGYSNPFGTTPSNNNGNPPTPSELYDTAVTTQMGDYDRIMEGYRNSSNRVAPIRTAYNPIQHQNANYVEGERYQQSEASADLLRRLRQQADTGGYSTGDLSNIRARSVSPIRAAYAAANRNANRATNLAGGYSPNAGAIQAKLAREQSTSLADASTNAEASIADLVAGGRRSALSAMSPLVAQEQELMTRIAEQNAAERRRVAGYNTEGINRTNELNRQHILDVDRFNASLEDNADDDVFRALQGQQSLYSTTPGLINTFGQQALTERGQDIQQENTLSNIPRRRRNPGMTRRSSFG
jgi:hypothetical protein